MEQQRWIGREFRSVNNLLKRRREGSEVHKYVDNLTGMHGWVIGYLCDHQGQDVFQRDLEEQFMVRRSTATGILQLMERNGLISREAVSRDKRLKKIVLTPKALELHQKIHGEIMRTEALMRQNIPPEELEIFFRVMDRIKANLGEKGPGKAPVPLNKDEGEKI